MAEEKYLTNQERVDNQTMKIENENLIGSGFIKHPPQERNPQHMFNDQFPDRRYDDFSTYNRGRGRFQYSQQQQYYKFRPYYHQNRYQYNQRSGGRQSYRTYRPQRGSFRPGGGPRNAYPYGYRNQNWSGPQRPYQNDFRGYGRFPRYSSDHVAPQFPNYSHQHQEGPSMKWMKEGPEDSSNLEEKESEVKNMDQMDNGHSTDTPNSVM